MARVKIATEARERLSVDIELARLRDVDVKALRECWEATLGKKAPAHLPRHLLYRLLAYRLQADRMGDLDAESRRILDQSSSPEQASSRATEVNRRTNNGRPGTVLGREWNGQMYRVAVMADGFAWNGATYPSLTKVAFAITGTRWNGPKFFGLRESLRSGGGERS